VRALILTAIFGGVLAAAEPVRLRWSYGGQATPVKLDKTAADAVVREIQKDRADTEAWLRGDITSYLATVDRQDFGTKKALTVGRAADSDLRIDDGEVMAHHLKVTVEGDKFRVQAVDAAAKFSVGTEDKREAVVDPSSVRIGRFQLRLSHQRYPGIIVFDPKSPRFKQYKGLKYFPVDLAYRYEAPLTPNPKPETIVIQSTRGNQRNAQRVGWFDFVVGATPVRLEAVRLLEPGIAESDISVFFRDATSGNESYSIGRYVDVKKPTTRRVRSRSITTVRFRLRRTWCRSRFAPARWTHIIIRCRRLVRQGRVEVVDEPEHEQGAQHRPS
jgi:uncharacterized protein (DUF1684 family)